MTVAATAHPAGTVGPGAGGGWLYRPSLDLLLGAGAGYLVALPLLGLLTFATGIRSWPVALGALFGLLVSGPHYGATLLRVYERREDRRKYALFAVWATAALCGIFVLGLNDFTVGSLLVTLYATWSPWHFSGQNYGIALMFLHRRGVDVEPRAKRLLYASFLLSFGLAFLVMHGDEYFVTAASLPVAEGSVYRFLSLGLPAGFLDVAVPLAALAYVSTLVATAALLLRRARPRDLGAAACLVLLQALWFALPAASRALLDTPLDGLAFTVIWVSTAHALQYLWVTFYYARRESPTLRVAPYLGRALLAGSTVTIFPALIFAPGLLGRVPWDVGLAILLFSVVNLHHFVLDGAIWKLRDGRVARLLLRDAPAEPEAYAPSSRRSGFRWAFGALGAVSLAVAGLDAWEREVGLNRARGDVDRMVRASQRLAWIGRDTPRMHTVVGRLLARRNQPDAALAAYRRSLALFPTAAAWVEIGKLHASQARWQKASDAFAAALGVDPDHLPALAQAGRAWLELGRPDLARSSLERARRLAPGNAQIRRALRRAIAAEAG